MKDEPVTTPPAAAPPRTDEMIDKLLKEGKPLLHPLDGDPTADWMEGRGPRVYTCLLCGEKFPPKLYDEECPRLLRLALDRALADKVEAEAEHREHYGLLMADYDEATAALDRAREGEAALRELCKGAHTVLTMLATDHKDRVMNYVESRHKSLVRVDDLMKELEGAAK